MKDPSERRLLTAVVLSLALLWMWQILFAPRTQEPEAVLTVADSPAPIAPIVAPTAAGAAGAAGEAACLGVHASLASETSVLRVSDCGGVDSIRFKQTLAALPVQSWWSWLYDRWVGGIKTPWTPYQAGEAELDLLVDGQLMMAGRGDERVGGTWKITSKSPLVQERSASDGLKIIRTVAPGATAETWNVSVRFESDRPLQGPFWVGVADALQEHAGAYPINAGLTALVDGDLEAVSVPADQQGSTEVPGPVSWFGLGDRYYLAAIAPENSATAGTLSWSRVDATRVGAFLTLPDTSVAPGAPIEARYTLYAGQKDLAKLEAAGHELEEAASLGLFGLFAKFLLQTLYLLQKQIGNWGFSILALTLLVRLVTYPLTRAAVVSGRRMAALQPLIKELQAKYPDDKETLNREQMALFTKHGVNPLGGCLPMLIQMPVFFALYSALAYEPNLFHADFFYLRDLSSPDPYGFLGLFVVAGMYVQQLMMPTMSGMDPTQQTMMKLMPLVFGLMMFSVPAGVSLYYALNTVLAIVQQWYNTRSLPPVLSLGDANVAT